MILLALARRDPIPFGAGESGILTHATLLVDRLPALNVEVLLVELVSSE